MSKKLYLVNFPVCGKVSVEVEAGNEDEAIEKALNEEWLLNIQLADGYELTDFDSMSKLVEGNVFHGPLTQAHAEYIEDVEEEEA